jgi:hypothetical protein
MRDKRLDYSVDIATYKVTNQSAYFKIPHSEPSVFCPYALASDLSHRIYLWPFATTFWISVS